MADKKPTGPNQGNDEHGRQHAGSTSTSQHQQEHAPSQHDGGVGNLQDEPQSAEQAKERAAKAARAHKP